MQIADLDSGSLVGVSGDAIHAELAGRPFHVVDQIP